MACGGYLVQGLDKLFCLDDYHKSILQRLSGFLALMVMLSINMYSLKKFAGRLQIMVTLLKVVVIAIIILTGLYYLIFKGFSIHY
jgi:L-asparagine transporter-like permease